MNLTFNLSRVTTYLRYLAYLHLTKKVVPFLGIAGFYLFYLVLYFTFNMKGTMWYTVFHLIVNATLLISLIFESSRIFSSLHSPYSSLQEYALPISSMERFIGNMIFYLVIVIAIGIVNLLGIASLYISVGSEEAKDYINEQFTSTGFFSYSQFILAYLFFFAGSIYFKESAMIKSLLVLVIFYLLYSIYFETEVTSNFTNGHQELQLESDSSASNDDTMIKNIIHYGFYFAWVIFSYVKLSRSQYPG